MKASEINERATKLLRVLEDQDGDFHDLGPLELLTVLRTVTSCIDHRITAAHQLKLMESTVGLIGKMGT